MGNPEGNHEKENAGITSRDHLKSLAVGARAGLGMVAAESEAKTIEQNRIKGSRLEIMKDHNMPNGFARYKVHATFEGGKEKLVGSFFEMGDKRAKADFISKAKHPDFFDRNGRPNFPNIGKKHKKTALIVAGGFLSSRGHHQIEGIALENGEMVGENAPVGKLNGVLVIKNGVPEIQYLNQIPDINAFLAQAKKERWSVFQQSSYIRPGGQFKSSNPRKYELRFFVEGEGKKGVINFSEHMTYVEALQVMQKMAGFKIERAIGLDTGICSEGYFYDKSGTGYLMVDEDFGAGRDCTNMLVLYSDQ